MSMKKYLYILLAVVLCGCGNKYQYIPKDIERINVEIVRFDSAQLAVRKDSVKQDIEKLYSDYEEFMPMYVEGILRIPSEDTAYLCDMYAHFLTDTVMGFAQTNALTLKKFSDVDSLREALSTGFSRLHYLYPDWVLPKKVYLYVSGFNSAVAYLDSIMGVGVDMYLGSDYPYYNQVVYNYQKHTMRKECIAGDLLNMYLAYNVPFTSKRNRLLEQMIFRGKQMFLLSKLLPDDPSWEIIGYTKEQWQWCERYEQAIWSRIMENKDLFQKSPNGYNCEQVEQYINALKAEFSKIYSICGEQYRVALQIGIYLYLRLVNKRTKNILAVIAEINSISAKARANTRLPFSFFQYHGILNTHSVSP